MSVALPGGRERQLHRSVGVPLVGALTTGTFYYSIEHMPYPIIRLHSALAIIAKIRQVSKRSLSCQNTSELMNCTLAWIRINHRDVMGEVQPIDETS
jgi:hypothetical protein